MEKKDYAVTELAGKEVAGMKNPGVGEKISLTDLQAEHPLRVGTIRPWTEQMAADTNLPADGPMAQDADQPAETTVEGGKKGK